MLARHNISTSLTQDFLSLMRFSVVVTTLCFLVPILATNIAKSASLASTSLASTSLASTSLAIVSTAAPVHALLVSLTEGAQQPQLLLSPSVMPHGARLTPSQARVLRDADLLVLVGESFAAFESRVAPSATRRIVRLTEIEGITTLPLVEGHDEEEEHGEEEHGEEEHGVGGGIDPHVWLDIGNARVIVGHLAHVLAERDGGNAALYRKNAGKLDLSLRALDREMRSIVDGFSANFSAGKFLVLHDATAYFTARYGIDGEGGEDKERLYGARHNGTRDGVRHTLRVRQGLRRGDYRCVVVQPQLPRAVRERFLGFGVRVIEIDPLGVSLLRGKDFYARLLRGVAGGFRECFAR